MDNGPPPVELRRALNYRRWGATDIMSLPAGYLPRMNVALTYNDALRNYERGAKAGAYREWAEKNPESWEIVSWVLGQRMKNWGEDGSNK